MSTAGTVGRVPLEAVRRRLPTRTRLGVEGTGHLVGVLALLGLAAYCLLVASVPIRLVPHLPGPQLRWFAVVGWVLWLGAYLWSVLRVLRGRRGRRATQIVAISGLVWSVLLFAVIGATFAAPPALSFSVMLLCLAGRTRGILTIGLLLGYFGLSAKQLPPAELGRNFEEFALSSLIFYAIPRLVIFAGELERTRAELAHLAVSEQRLRWARDLHDTLGHGLSVVLLKLELVERLRQRDPARADAELRDARSLLRDSIGEMQTVVTGMRDVTLSGEIANASTILDAAGVTTHTDIGPVTVDPEVERAFAWIIREGVTNVLRHSNSSRCDITLRADCDRTVLTVANDGPEVRATLSPSGGNGIRGMRERLAGLGGTVTTRSRPTGGFVLEASVPVAAVPVVRSPDLREVLDLPVEVDR